MVFTLFGLLTRSASHDGCRGISTFFKPVLQITIWIQLNTLSCLSQQMAKQAQTLTRDAIQNETKRHFSTSQHSKQNKRFLATTTALNTNESSKYTCLSLPLIKSASLKEYFFTLFSAGAWIHFACFSHNKWPSKRRHGHDTRYRTRP